MPDREAAEGAGVVPCGGCGRPLPVEPEWRLVQCTVCGEITTRMGIDPRYD